MPTEDEIAAASAALLPSSKDHPDMLIIPEGRVFERHQGCWNCTQFLTGEDVKATWVTHRDTLLRRLGRSDLHSREAILAHPEAQLKVARLRQQGVSQTLAIAMVMSEVVAQDPRVAVITKAEVDINEGTLGICRTGASGTDFTFRKFLCDQWVGRDGASVARSTSGQDLLPGELREMVDGPEAPPTRRADAEPKK